MPDRKNDRDDMRVQRREFRELLGQMARIGIVTESTKPDHDAGQQRHRRENLRIILTSPDAVAAPAAGQGSRKIKSPRQ